jgi:hypothetical protein
MRRGSKLLRPILALSAIATLGWVTFVPAAQSQVAGLPPNAGPSIPTTGKGTVSGPIERTPQMIAADANIGPIGPVPPDAFAARPTMPQAQYAAMKAAANSAAPMSRNPELSPAGAATPVLTPYQFPGAQEGVVGYNEFPSDDDMDVSFGQVAQTTNSSLWVWDKAGNLQLQRSLNALLGTADFLGDAQILFDSTWKRWVISVDDFSIPNSTFNYLYLAVSTTSSATGGWYVYRIGFGGGDFVAPNFLDYPHMGMDQDALLFTGNIFNDSTGQYITTTAFAIPKARPYNGLGFGFGAFTGLAGTLMPPVQLGAPFYGHFPVDYFAAAVPSTGHVVLYGMVSSSTSPYMFGVGTVNSVTFLLPPSAVQPGCANINLDTLDGRFQNACYQIPPPNNTYPDGLLYCVHTVSSANLPTPTWYAFDPSSLNAVSSGQFFYSGTSNDFNPSIAADALGDIFVTETATDPTGSKKPMVLFGGSLVGNPVTLNTSTPAGTSSVCLNGNPSNTSPQRWGDYSAARFDPNTSYYGTAGLVKGWITNQKVAGQKTWGTRIAKIKQ